MNIRQSYTIELEIVWKKPHYDKQTWTIQVAAHSLVHAVNTAVGGVQEEQALRPSDDPSPVYSIRSTKATHNGRIFVADELKKFGRFSN